MCRVLQGLHSADGEPACQRGDDCAGFVHRDRHEGGGTSCSWWQHWWFYLVPTLRWTRKELLLYDTSVNRSHDKNLSDVIYNLGSIVLHYHFPSGIQGPDHPNPGNLITQRHCHQIREIYGIRLHELLLFTVMLLLLLLLLLLSSFFSRHLVTSCSTLSQAWGTPGRAGRPSSQTIRRAGRLRDCWRCASTGGWPSLLGARSPQVL